MVKIPEYNFICASKASHQTIIAVVKIDGKTGMIPSRPIELRVVVRLAEAFLTGEFVYMSFDEHPKKLTGINLTTKSNSAKVIFSARSIRDDDDFPKNWDTLDAIL
jgi:hypothetical protein